MFANIFLRIFVYGVPIMFIILGILALIENEIIKSVFAGDLPLNIFGILLIIGGVIIFVTISRFGIR